MVFGGWKFGEIGWISIENFRKSKTLFFGFQLKVVSQKSHPIFSEMYFSSKKDFYFQKNDQYVRESFGFNRWSPVCRPASGSVQVSLQFSLIRNMIKPRGPYESENSHAKCSFSATIWS